MLREKAAKHDPRTEWHVADIAHGSAVSGSAKFLRDDQSEMSTLPSRDGSIQADDDDDDDEEEEEEDVGHANGTAARCFARGGWREMGCGEKRDGEEERIPIGGLALPRGQDDAEGAILHAGLDCDHQRAIQCTANIEMQVWRP
jgi:hypothetical protein